jgi:hypothetical protein
LPTDRSGDHDESDDTMGRYDDIPPEQIRADLIRFARLLLRLDEEGRLLRSIPHVQSLLGDLRQKLFAHEVRGTRNLPGAETEEHSEEDTDSMGLMEAVEDTGMRDSLRIVREALARQEEAAEEWGKSEDGSVDDTD